MTWTSKAALMAGSILGASLLATIAVAEDQLN